MRAELQLLCYFSHVLSVPCFHLWVHVKDILMSILYKQWNWVRPPTICEMEPRDTDINHLIFMLSIKFLFPYWSWTYILLLPIWNDEWTGKVTYQIGFMMKKSIFSESKHLRLDYGWKQERKNVWFVDTCLGKPENFHPWVWLWMKK